MLALQPSAQERHIGCKGEQQPKGERELDPLAKYVEVGSHGLTIRRFYTRSPTDSFFQNLGLVYDSAEPKKVALPPQPSLCLAAPDIHPRFSVRSPLEPFGMPYALFCNEAKLSKAYPTEADVWRLARQSGLVVDVTISARRSTVQLQLDNDYEIRPCAAEPEEDPWQNRAEAEHEFNVPFSS